MKALAEFLYGKVNSFIRSTLLDLSKAKHQDGVQVFIGVRQNLFVVCVNNEVIYSIEKQAASSMNTFMIRKMVSEAIAISSLSSGKTTHVTLYVSPKGALALGFKKTRELLKNWPGDTRIEDTVVLTYSNWI